ncbi:hypothetical protein, partial [Candidatus Uabimicrobium amorphum]
MASRKKKLLLEPLEQRIMLDAVPDVQQLDVPATGFLNEAFSFDITFENDGDQEGFRPFIDLTIPNGIDVDSIQFAGTELAKSEIEFKDKDGDGIFVAKHPITGETLIQDTQEGTIPLETVFAVEIPFGSFTNEQVVDITVTGTLNNQSLLGVPLDIKAQGIFAFGNDALNNPGEDPPIRGELKTSSITPTVLQLDKANDAPEGETATGPNFARTFTLTIDVADQETVDNIVVIDTLPDNLEFLGVTDDDGIVAEGGVISFDAATNQLRIDIASISGELGPEKTIDYQAFVKEFDGNNNNVVDPVNGAPGVSINQAVVTADFTDPDNLVIDTDGDEIPDAPETVVITDDAESTIQDLALAIQKSATIIENPNTNVVGVSPGDTIEYTINFQVSDFFDLQNLVFNDQFSDGQIFDNAFTPTFQIFNNNGLEVPVTQFAAEDFDVVVNADETTNVTFRIDGDFTGGLSDDPNRLQNNGGLTGQIKFQTTVLEEFKLDGSNLDAGDSITNDITVSAEIDGNRFTFDDSGTVLTINEIQAQKKIIALNGIAAEAGSVVPGDTVTFSLFTALPTTDVEDFFIKDFLPLPIFEAIEFNNVNFTNEISADPPEAGVIRFGARTSGLPTNPDGTIDAQFIPDITVDAAQNSILFDFGDIEFENANSAEVEIVFTVTTTDAPFGEGLLLTNQAINSFSALQEQSIINFKVREAVLDIDKAVVSTSNPDANFLDSIGPVVFDDPGSAGVAFSETINSQNIKDNRINSNVEDVNGGDLVKFAIVVENTGTARNGAFDILITDNIPPGFEIPDIADFPQGINLQVTDGAGNVLDFTNANDGAIVDGLELFADGIKLVDNPGDPANDIEPSGALATAAFLQIDPENGEVEIPNTTGSNILVITYDLAVIEEVPANSKHVNEAFIENFATAEGGENFAVADNGNAGLDLSDKAVAIIQDVQIDKQIINTSVGDDVNREVAIGEVVTFQLEVTLPDGQNDLNLIDNLPPGFDFIEGSARVITDIDGDGTDDFDGQNNADGSFDFTEVIVGDTVLAPEVDVQLEAFVNGVLVDNAFDAAENTEGGDSLVFVTTLTGGGDADALDIVLTQEIPPASVINNITLDIPGTSEGAITLIEDKHFTVFDGTIIFNGIDDIERSLINDLGLGAQMIFTIDTTVANVEPNTIDIAQQAEVNGVVLDADGVANLQDGDIIEFTTTLTHNGTTPFTINPPVSYLETLPANTTFDPNSVRVVSEGFISTLSSGSFEFNAANNTLEITEFGRTQDLTIGEVMEIQFSVVVGEDPVAEQDILENDVVVDVKPVSVEDLTEIPRATFGGDVAGNLAFTFRDVETFNDSGTFLVEYKAIVTNDAANVGLNNPQTAANVTNTQVTLFSFDSEKNRTTISYQNQLENLDTDDGDITNEDGATRIVFNDVITGKLDKNSITADGIGLVEGTHFVVEGNNLKIFDLSSIEELGPDSTALIRYVSVVDGEFNQVINDQSSVTFLDAEQTVLNNEVFADVLNDGTAAVKDIEHVIVTEPQLIIDKQMGDGIFDAGDTVEITLTVANPSTTDPFTGAELENGATGAAFDIVIEDILDNELFVAGSVVFTETPAGFVGTETDNGDNTSTIEFAKAVDATSSNTIGVDEELTFTFNVTLATTVNGNEFISNTAQITEYSSVPNIADSVPVDENNPSEDELRLLADDALAIANQRTFDAVDSNEDQLRINTIEVQKAIVGDTDFTVGEIINYRVIIDLPEATLPQFTFNDILDEGLAFVGVTSITAATGITTTIGNNNFDVVAANQVISDEGNGDTAVARKLDLNFGTVVNTNFTDGLATDNNTITIEYQAVVLNANVVQDGETLDNTVTISYEGREPDSDDATATVNIVEPNISIDKVVLDAETGDPVENTGGDAGDQLIFQITLTSDGNADAFDIVLSDAIPDGISLVPGTLQTVSGTTDQLNEDIANNSIEVVVEELLIGQSVTVQFQIDVDDDVVLGEAIQNNADVTFTSLGDDAELQLAGSGAANILAVERTGDPNDPGEDNNFTAEDDASVTIFEPVLTKSIVATSAAHTDANASDNVQVAIGEVVRFRLDIEFPETVLDDTVIRDQLAEGLEFLGNTTLSFVAEEDFGNPANIEGADNDAIPPTFDLDAVAGAVVQNGQDLQFNIGDIQNNDRDDNAERIIIEFDAIVKDNLAINLNNTQHQNTFDLDGEQLQDVRTSNQVQLNVEEPILQTKLTQQVNGETVDNDKIGNFDAGDIITYTAEVSHAGDSQSDAFDLTIALDIPAQTVIDATSFVIGGIAVDPTPFIVDDGNGNLSIELNADDLNNIAANLDDLALNDALVITYDTVVQDQANPGDTFAIDFDVDFTTLPGDVDDDANDQLIEERTRSVNNSIQMDSVKQIAVETNIGVDNDNDGVVDLTDFQIGDDVPVQIDADVLEGTNENVVITQVIPAGIDFDLNTFVINLDNGVTAENVTDNGDGTFTIDPTKVTTAVDGDGNTVLTIELGDVVNEGSTDFNPEQLGDANTRGDIQPDITINFDGTVLDDAVNNNNGDTKDFATTITTADDAGNEVASDNDNDQVAIIEAVLDVAVTQAVTNDGVTTAVNDDDVFDFDAGDTISYTATINHNAASANNAEAFDLNIALDIPVNTELRTLDLGDGNIINDPVVLANFTVDTNGDGIDDQIQISDAQLEAVGLENLARNDTLVVNYNVEILDTAVVGDNFAVDATVDFDSQEDVGPNTDAAGNEISRAGQQAQDNIAINSAAQIAVETNIGVDNNNDGVVDLTDFQIGDDIPVQIDADVLEGTSENVIITQVIPAGIEFDLNTFVINLDPGVTAENVTDNGDGTFTIDPTKIITAVDGDGNTVLTIELGDVVNEGSANFNPEQLGDANTRGDDQPDITINFDTVVLDDVANNNNGDAKDFATAITTADDAGNEVASDNDNDQVQIAEPILDIALAQQINGESVNDGVAFDFDAGDTITYNAIFSHNNASTAEAFDLNISLDIPQNTEIQRLDIGGNILDVNNGDDLTPFLTDDNGDGVFDRITISDTQLQLLGLDDLPLGDDLQVNFDALLLDTANPGDDFIVNANVDFDSQDNVGDNDIQRPNNAVNSINVLSTNVINVETTLGNDTAQVGDSVPVTIDTDVVEGTTENVIIRQVIPAGIEIDEAQILAGITLGNNITTDDPQVQIIDNGDGTQTLVVNFGDVVKQGNDGFNIDNLGDTNDVNDNDFDIRIEFDAEVLNDVDVNNNGNRKDFQTTVESQDDAGNIKVSSLQDADSFTIVEPVLDIQQQQFIDDGAGNLVEVNDGSLDVAVDAGNIITYVSTISHNAASSGDAFDLTYSEVIPENTLLDTNSVAVTFTDENNVANTVSLVENTHFTFDADTGDFIIFNLDDAGLGITDNLPQNNTLTVTYDTIVQDDARPGDVFTTNAQIDFDSVDGDDVNERDGSANDDVSLASAKFINVEAHVGDGVTDFQIGDSIPVTIDGDVLEGTTENVVFTQVIPAGIDFNLDTFVISLDDGVTAANVTDNGDGTFTIDPTKVTTALDGDGNTILTVELGDVVNEGNAPFNPEVLGDPNNVNDNDFDIRITFDGEVLNDDALNNNGDNKGFVTSVESQDDNGDAIIASAEDNDTVNIVEPVLDIVQQQFINNRLVEVNDGSLDIEIDAGDIISYTSTITHNGSSAADAFDLNYTDVIPAGTLLKTDTVVVIFTDAQGNTTGELPLNVNEHFTFDADTGDFTILNLDGVNGINDNLPQGATLEIRYDTIVQDTANPGDVFATDAQINFDSVDGDNDNERDGSANDKVSLASKQFINVEAHVGIDNDNDGVVDVTDFQIGDNIPITIDVDVVEGTTENVVVQQILPAGIELDAAEILAGITRGADVTTDAPQVQIVDNGDGTQTLTVDFGNVVNAGNNNDLFNPEELGDPNNVDDNNFDIRIEFGGEILNDEALNNNGDNKAFVTSVESQDNNGDAVIASAEDNDAISIIEPVLDIVQQQFIDDGNGNIVEINDGDTDIALDAGDTISYTSTVTHNASSTADAFDLTYTDIVPEDTLLDTDSVTVTFNNGAPIALVENVHFTFDPVTREFNIFNLDDANLGIDNNLPQDNTLAISYDVVIQNTAVVGDTFATDAQINFDSVEGVDANERSKSANDNVILAAEANIDLEAHVGIDANNDGVIDDTEFQIGESVPISLDVSLVEGVTENVVIEQIIPAGIEIDVNDVLAGITFDADATPERAQPIVQIVDNGDGTQTLSIDFGDVTNNGNDGAADPEGALGDPQNVDDNQFDIRIEFNGEILNDNALNNNGDVKSFFSTVQSRDDNGNVVIASGVEQDSITIIEPVLDIVQQQFVDNVEINDGDIDVELDAGDTISYISTINHNASSTADAFDLVYTDTVPENTLLDLNSVEVSLVDQNGDPVLDENGAPVIVELQANQFTFDEVT